MRDTVNEKERKSEIDTVNERGRKRDVQLEREKERYTHSERDTVGGERDKNIQIERDTGMYR